MVRGPFLNLPFLTMFPSFSSPDDPERGVRAASKAFPNRSIPKNAPGVTLISKTKGGPYRHEILETSANTRKKSVSWAGDNSLLDNTKFSKNDRKVFYPAPSKTILPNPKLRDWDLSLSERTSNMLRNLERSLWVTSYQMEYTGSGPANPLKMDDFREKVCGLNGIHSHSAPLRERSYPMFTFKPKQRQRNTWNTATAGHQYPFPNLNTASQNLQEFRGQDQRSSESHERLLSGSSSEEEEEERGIVVGRDLPYNTNLLPRPRTLPGIHQSGSALSLLELQRSFSKSEAHNNFNSSSSQAAVNLRENVVSGKKHNFFGMNCNYIHG